MPTTPPQHPLSIADRVRALVAEARVQQRWIAVLDVRYITAGLPAEITDEYIYFTESYELDTTGKLGSRDAKGEKALPKMILWSSVIHVEHIPPVK